MFRNGIRLYNKDFKKLFSNVCGELYKYILGRKEWEKRKRDKERETEGEREREREREVMRG